MDEFGGDDGIDWSTVQLPSASASNVVPRAAPVNNSGGTAAGPSANNHTSHSAGYHNPPLNDHGDTMAGRDHHHFNASMGNNRTASNNFSSLAGNNGDVDSLRRQIQNLQTQLQTKDDQIFELEATAATSAVESTHRTQRAESDAKKRIHLIEEELRRTRMEAEKFRGSWIRQKRRVAELEQVQQGGEGGGNQTINNAAAAAAAEGRTNHLSAWGLPTDVALRKVTPTISHEENFDNAVATATAEYGDDGENTTSPTIEEVGGGGSKKRKSPKISNAGDTDAVKNESGDFLPRRLLGLGRKSNSRASVGSDSVRQRMARHLLNRVDMGCYSLSQSGYAKTLSSMLAESMEVDVDNDDDSGETPHNPSNGEAGGTLRRHFPHPTNNATKQDLFIEEETQSFVKSILYQMVEAPESSTGPGMSATGNDNLSVSGLVHVLLMRFNSLFRCLENKDGAALDGDGDQVMGEETSDPNNVREGGDRFKLGKNKIEYQKMALILSSSSGCATYATVSWRAALLLLRIIHDILVLSGNARDDLRWWFYQADQLAGGGGAASRSNTSSPSSIEHEAGQGATGIGEAIYHSRIEGLPPICGRGADCNEVLWTKSCRSTSGDGQSNIWDPMTMVQPCNTFFDLLVGLMKGNVFEHSQKDGAEKDRRFVLDQTLVQFAQLKAIELVLTLMSDAPPYDHAENSHGNRTPYLWKFWFDSLLPSCSSTAQTVLNESLDSDHQIGDFFSPCEKSDGHYNHSLGSGRKHSTRLLKNVSIEVIQHAKRDVEKQGRTGSRAAGGNAPSEGSDTKSDCQLSILVKSRILELLTHFTLCSSSVDQSMRQIVGEKDKSCLAKRILAAVLDDMEEYIVPFLSSGCSSSDLQSHNVEICLQLCFSCIQYLLIMSRSNEGIRMLRLQMRLEPEQGEQPSRWAQSAIGCVTSLLDSTLSFALGIEDKETMVVKCTHLSHALNAIVEQCVTFFKTILLFVYQQRDSASKSAHFTALISEHRTIFLSCCHRILAHQSPSTPRLLHFGEGLRLDVRELLEESILFDSKEDGD